MLGPNFEFLIDHELIIGKPGLILNFRVPFEILTNHWLIRKPYFEYKKRSQADLRLQGPNLRFRVLLNKNCSLIRVLILIYFDIYFGKRLIKSIQVLFLRIPDTSPRGSSLLQLCCFLSSW